MISCFRRWRGRETIPCTIENSIWLPRRSHFLGATCADNGQRVTSIAPLHAPDSAPSHSARRQRGSLVELLVSGGCHFNPLFDYVGSPYPAAGRFLVNRLHLMLRHGFRCVRVCARPLIHRAHGYLFRRIEKWSDRKLPSAST